MAFKCLHPLGMYSRVQKSWNEVFFKILKKPSIVQKKMIPHMKGLDFSQGWSKKKIKMTDLENSKWPPQKNLIFQLRQFSIFFHEILMDWFFQNLGKETVPSFMHTTVSTLFLALWVPCSWQNVPGYFSYKKLLFSGLKHINVKYDIGRKEFGK